MKNNLAIVIPIFKPTFLRASLDSLAKQTVKKFNVYLCNDASPFDIKSIVSEFEGKFNFLYYEFDYNLGGINLVQHWKRCIELIGDENWVWLFSDDDIIEENCVEKFYESLRISPNFDVYHFNVKMIDSYGCLIREFSKFDKIITSREFFARRAENKIASFVVEYIFSIEVYKCFNGFQNFDLAWGADHATWIKFASLNGIYTIEDAYVLWRKSTQNISPNISDISICRRKIYASSEYYLWANTFFDGEGISARFFLISFINDCKLYNCTVAWSDFKRCIFSFIFKLYKNKLILQIYLVYFVVVLYMFSHRILKLLKNSCSWNEKSYG